LGRRLNILKDDSQYLKVKTHSSKKEETTKTEEGGRYSSLWFVRGEGSAIV